MSAVIQINNISKQYRLGQIGTGSIAHDINRRLHQIRGKGDPYLKIGEENDSTAKGKSEYVWALRNINFEVQQGEVLGIIGRNGAGKSTLLKILSRTTTPTTGTIKVKGRIASLLEVGTGFHPELSGRENVYLNGAILGMTKKEITKKFDEIVDFAGVEKYIDTPVKRYSSGMYVRLAFGVAAHLEPEILIVDEVLAVGDAEFQKKALGKMKDVSEKDGRTVLFVSHNMNVIQKLCTRGVYFENGKITKSGNINVIASEYLHAEQVAKIGELFKFADASSSMSAQVQSVSMVNRNGELVSKIQVGSFWTIKILVKLSQTLDHFIVALGLSTALDENLRTSWSAPQQLKEGVYEFTFAENELLFAAGKYYLSVGLSTYERTIQYLERAVCFEISDIQDREIDPSILRTSGTGLILNPMKVSCMSVSN